MTLEGVDERSSELSWDGVPLISGIQDTKTLILVISRWSRSLYADGPDGLSLVILIDDPADIGLGSL